MLYSPLLLQTTEAPGAPRRLEVNQVIEEIIDRDDQFVQTPTLDEHYTPLPIRAKRYELSVGKSGYYYIDLRSRFFDSYLILRDSGGNVIGEDDDGWIPSQSRLVVQLAAGLSYSVDACAMHGGVGSFTISFHPGEPKPPSTAELAGWSNDPRTQSMTKRYEGRVLFDDGKYQEAELVFDEAFLISEKSLGRDSQEYSACCYELGRLARVQRKSSVADSYLKQALYAQESILGAEDLLTGDTYEEYGRLLLSESKVEEARVFFGKAQVSFERNLPRFVGKTRYEVLLRCATTAHRLEEWELGEKYYRECLPIAESRFGSESEMLAYLKTQLGLCLLNQGNWDSAREFFLQALKIAEGQSRQAGAGPITLRNWLAFIAERQGDLSLAESLLAESLRSAQGTFGNETGIVAEILVASASLDFIKRDFESAKSKYERADSILFKIQGLKESHAMELANIAMESLDLDEAKRLLFVAQKNSEKIGKNSKTYGEAIPQAMLRAAFGRLHYLAGEFAEAVACYQESVRILSGYPGDIRSGMVSLYSKLARVNLESGRIREAWENARLSYLTAAGNLGALMGSLTELERYDFIVAQRLAIESVLDVSRISSNPESREFAFEALCQWKAWVFQGMLSTKQRAFLANSEKMFSAVSQLRKVQSRLSALVGQARIGQAGFSLEKINQLAATRTQLEKTIAQGLGSERGQGRISCKEICKSLPENSSFVSFFERRTYLPPTRTDGNATTRPTWSKPQMEAWVLSKDKGSPVEVPLGASEDIEALLREYLTELVACRSPRELEGRSRLARLNGEVLRRIWLPIAERIQGKLVLLSMDGCLGGLPFGVIQQENGRYLLEDFTFVCLQDIRSLLEFSKKSGEHKGSFLVAGGFDFDGKPNRVGSAEENQSVGSKEHARGSWQALPATDEEAQLLWRLHEEVLPKEPRLLLRGVDPSEERLKLELPRFSFIHLASHGFFDPEGMDSFWRQFQLGEPDMASVENIHVRFQGLLPGFFSGVVCAGINKPAVEKHENGSLTAEEVSWLNLSNCELVVLSGCQTGLGTVRGGEGIIGLRSAFRQAGARTVISSLWSIGDQSTKELMSRFYKALWIDGKGVANSLRDAQLEMLEFQRHQYNNNSFPYSWGGFVVDGDWN